MITPHKQFEILMEQLQIKDVPKSMNDGEILKIIVDKKNKIWEFNFQFNELPIKEELFF